MRFTSDLRYRNLVLRSVQASAKLVGTSENSVFVDQVVTACGEAFNNVVLHAYADGPGEVEIQIEVRESSVFIRMLDHGRSCEFDSVPWPDLDALPEGGVGIYLIKTVMDVVNYRAGNPNVLEMTKHLDNAMRQATTL